MEQQSSELHTYVLMLLRMMRRRSPRLAFWGHGAHLNKEAHQVISDVWTRFWLNKVDHWFAYTDLSDEIVRHCGFKKEKITVAQNSIDTRKLRDAYDALSEGDPDMGQFRPLLVKPT